MSAPTAPSALMMPDENEPFLLLIPRLLWTLLAERE
jgi:hypothetical protein